MTTNVCPYILVLLLNLNKVGHIYCRSEATKSRMYVYYIKDFVGFLRIHNKIEVIDPHSQIIDITHHIMKKCIASGVSNYIE